MRAERSPAAIRAAVRPAVSMGRRMPRATARAAASASRNRHQPAAEKGDPELGDRRVHLARVVEEVEGGSADAERRDHDRERCRSRPTRSRGRPPPRSAGSSAGSCGRRFTRSGASPAGRHRRSPAIVRRRRAGECVHHARPPRRALSVPPPSASGTRTERSYSAWRRASARTGRGRVRPRRLRPDSSTADRDGHEGDDDQGESRPEAVPRAPGAPGSRSGAHHPTRLVPEAADSLDEGGGGGGRAHLGPQAPDGDVDEPRIAEVVVAPDASSSTSR